jgi:hypothetical protein
MDDEFSLQFTTQELGYLGTLFQPPADDLSLGFDSAKAPMAQASLAGKNYLRPPTAEEGLAIDESVAALISVVGDPQLAAIAATFRGKTVEPEEWQLFAARGLIVDKREESSDTHILTACRTREVALARLVDFLGLEKQPAAHTESFHIAAEDMAQVPYVIAGDGPEDGAAFLREAGAPAKAAARLAAALDNPVRQSVLRTAVWVDGEPQEVGRLTLLEEVYGLWLIAPAEAGGDTLAVAPVTAVEAIDRVRELVFQVLPGGPA